MVDLLDLAVSEIRRKGGREVEGAVWTLYVGRYVFKC